MFLAFLVKEVVRVSTYLVSPSFPSIFTLLTVVTVGIADAAVFTTAHVVNFPTTLSSIAYEDPTTAPLNYS